VGKVASGRIMKWEKLKSDFKGTHRCKVPGGWFVIVYGSGVTFYPDPEHKWDGSSLP
jgi:hypothetical protein